MNTFFTIELKFHMIVSYVIFLFMIKIDLLRKFSLTAARPQNI